jgi:hypothetical protein
LATAVTNRARKTEEMWSSPISSLVLALCAVVFLVHGSASAVFGGQTREECNACCARSGYDQYYEEQCKLKCFRNHDHCTGKSARPTTPAADARQPDRQPDREPATEPDSEQRQPREPVAAKEADIRLAYPNPLNLVAGKEGEAAAQILAVNGVSPQHPFYNAALQDIQIVLIDFVKRNPQGGKLPTTQLKRILKQLK